MSATAKIITYDLDSPGQKYRDLINEIENYTYVKLTESCYVVETNESYKQIYKKLLVHTDSNDRLFVSNLAKGSSWINIIGDSGKYKKMNKITCD